MQFMQLRKGSLKKKIQKFNGVWTRDLVITSAMLYQLSYEATDIGSRSIVGSYVSMKEILSVNDIWNKSFMNCRNEMKWRNDCSSETQFMQLRKDRSLKKIQDFNGIWTLDLKITRAMLYQLSYEATDVGSRSVLGCSRNCTMQIQLSIIINKGTYVLYRQMC